MLMPYGQKWKTGKKKGQFNCFDFKILRGLYLNGLTTPLENVSRLRELRKFKGLPKYYYAEDQGNDHKPKIHTLRNQGRWKIGDTIQSVIYAAKMKPLFFAPELRVVSIQKVSIIWGEPWTFRVFIDGVKFWQTDMRDNSILTQSFTDSSLTLLKFVQNDGFDTIEDFAEYFKGDDFVGDLIHWTDAIITTFDYKKVYS